MEAQSLYTAGWHQGTIVTGPFVAAWLDADESGRGPTTRTLTFERGVICTQNCDLSACDSMSDEFPIEIRRVQSADTPNDWGIRSRNLRLSSTEHVNAEDPRSFVTPRFLTAECKNEKSVQDGRAVALKTWLGLRFDRPAVPEHLVEPAREVARRFGSRSGRAAAAQVHDVLMQFDDSKNPPHVALFAVIEDGIDHFEIRKWLADAAKRVNTDIALVAHIDVATRSGTSLALVESSYAADLSQVTWTGAEPSGST